MLRQIAAGAYGSVHCVQRKDTKVIHAAKHLKSKNSDFKRELGALQDLSGKSREEIQWNSLKVCFSMKCYNNLDILD